MSNPTLYPVVTPIPPVEVQPGLDFLLLELPPKYIPMMPNGVGYVHNILEASGVKHQTIDMCILLYHKYHSGRILEGKKYVTKGGRPLGEDPWDILSEGLWHNKDFLDFFWPSIVKLLDEITKKRPKIVGVSLNSSNRSLAKRFLAELKKRAPGVIKMVGGYDCIYEDFSRAIVEHFDYMLMGESECTLIPLVKKVLSGEEVKDMPGVISRFDSPGKSFVPATLPEDLDMFGFPKYEWIDLSYYHTYANGHAVPITASRGCVWAKCCFCGECFSFRLRDPEKVADEIEWWTKKGLTQFLFNESDVNGNVKSLFDLCSIINKRGLKVHLSGQLRVDRRNSLEHFQTLAKAGFHSLRFGVDAWSANTLKLQKKGYTLEHVRNNVRACHEAGIRTTVNMLLGVPGETEEDIDEMIKNVVELKDSIACVENINTLYLILGSDYYKNPEEHNIRFRKNKEDIYKSIPADAIDGCPPLAIPDSDWFSEEPYIDQNVRVKRLNRVLEALFDNGVQIGPYAAMVVKRLKAERETPNGSCEKQESEAPAKKGMLTKISELRREARRKAWELKKIALEKIPKKGELRSLPRKVISKVPKIPGAVKKRLFKAKTIIRKYLSSPATSLE